MRLRGKVEGGREQFLAPCQPYIESATALSHYEFIARNDGFWRAQLHPPIQTSS